MISIKHSHESFVPSGNSSFSDATNTAGIEIRNNNNPAGSPTSHSSSPFSSLPCPADKIKGPSHFPDKHLPIRSLSSHELRSADKLDGLPEKYLTGMIDVNFCVLCSCVI